MINFNLWLSFFAFWFGAAIGSFLNVCIYRIPNEKSLISPPSHCPHCQKSIRFYDNIPIISYFLLRGKCRFCGQSISAQYIVVELLAAIVSLILFQHYSLLEYFIYFVFFSSLLIIAFIDLKHQIIPNIISIPGIGIGLLASIVLPRITYLESLFGIILGGGILYLVAQGYYLATKTEGMGMGDVKLLAMIGAFLGTKAVITTVFLSAFLGALVGITIM
ncbi:MAG: prepilin peptidase, partial [Desulfobacterota bacterium]|nr:prepilin peptidase [Thermodesulfobacteriota bacterium]